MKDIKKKPAGRVPKSNTAGKIPKAALKKAWTEAKEKSRTKLRESTSTQGDGDYTAANDTGGAVADTSYSAIKQNTGFTVQQGRKFARKQTQKYRESTETILPHTASERGVSPKQGSLPYKKQPAAPEKLLQQHARLSVTFLPVCTALLWPLPQASVWQLVLLLSSALWHLFLARPTAYFLPPMPQTKTPFLCKKPWKSSRANTVTGWKKSPTPYNMTARTL